MLLLTHTPYTCAQWPRVPTGCHTRPARDRTPSWQSFRCLTRLHRAPHLIHTREKTAVQRGSMVTHSLTAGEGQSWTPFGLRDFLVSTPRYFPCGHEDSAHPQASPASSGVTMLVASECPLRHVSAFEGLSPFTNWGLHCLPEPFLLGLRGHGHCTQRQQVESMMVAATH